MVGLSYGIYPNNHTHCSCFVFQVVWYRSTLPISFKVTPLAVGSHAPLSVEQGWRVRVDKSGEPHNNDANSGTFQANYRGITKASHRCSFVRRIHREPEMWKAWCRHHVLLNGIWNFRCIKTTRLSSYVHVQVSSTLASGAPFTNIDYL